MQTMNQSLISLLAHSKITYDQAVESSWDADDLSLKLRRMFPNIEEQFRKGKMAPSAADFSQITELLETKKLYEETEERHKQQMFDKDEQLANLETEIRDLREMLDTNSGDTSSLRTEAEQAKVAVERIREESNQKIAALNERIRDLNQRLQDGGGGKGQSGFFKR